MAVRRDLRLSGDFKVTIFIPEGLKCPYAYFRREAFYTLLFRLEKEFIELRRDDMSTNVEVLTTPPNTRVPAVPQEAPEERYCTDSLTWEAVYEETDESIWECDREGVIIHKYSDIDRTRVTALRVYRTRDRLEFESPKPVLIVRLEPGYRLIWRKRRSLRIVDGVSKLVAYLIGWQATIEGYNVQSILYVYPDGSLELAQGKGDIELFAFEEIYRQDSPGGEVS